MRSLAILCVLAVAAAQQAPGGYYRYHGGAGDGAVDASERQKQGLSQGAFSSSGSASQQSSSRGQFSASGSSSGQFSASGSSSGQFSSSGSSSSRFSASGTSGGQSSSSGSASGQFSASGSASSSGQFSSNASGSSRESSSGSGSGSGSGLSGRGGSGTGGVNIDPSFACPETTVFVTTTRFRFTKSTNQVHSTATSIITKYVTSTVLEPRPYTVTQRSTVLSRPNLGSAQRIITSTQYNVATNFLDQTKLRYVTDHVSYTDTTNHYFTATETVPLPTTITAFMTTFKTFVQYSTQTRTLVTTMTYTRTAVTTSVIFEVTTATNTELRTRRLTTTKDVVSSLPAPTVTRTLTVCDQFTIGAGGRGGAGFDVRSGFSGQQAGAQQFSGQQAGAQQFFGQQAGAQQFQQGSQTSGRFQQGSQTAGRFQGGSQGGSQDGQHRGYYGYGR